MRTALFSSQNECIPTINRRIMWRHEKLEWKIGLVSMPLIQPVPSDVGWSSLLHMLAYKAESAGRQLVRVDPRGTSRRYPCGKPAHKKLSNGLGEHSAS